MLLAQTSPLVDGAVWSVVLASLSLVGLALGLSWWLGIGIEREVVVASARAAVQLLAVGVLFTFIFESEAALVLAITWVVVMVAVAANVIRRRAAQPIPGLAIAGFLAVTATALISIVVTFGFGVFEMEPVSLVVVAGITIGNAVPSAVLGVKQAVATARDGADEIEAALALGLGRRQVVRFMAPRAAKASIVPQVERTKVVGLIALPGAMTGLLLAGVDPIDAVIVQLVVMYLVLGAVSVAVIVVVTVIAKRALTTDLRLESWIRP